jgi:hypothetical protein
MLYNSMLYNTIQYNSMLYSTVQYNTIQYIQYNTIQYNTIQFSLIEATHTILEDIGNEENYAKKDKNENVSTNRERKALAKRRKRASAVTAASFEAALEGLIEVRHSTCATLYLYHHHLEWNEVCRLHCD